MNLVESIQYVFSEEGQLVKNISKSKKICKEHNIDSPHIDYIIEKMNLKMVKFREFNKEDFVWQAIR